MNNRKFKMLDLLNEKINVGKKFVETLKIELQIMKNDMKVLHEELDVKSNMLANLSSDIEVKKYIKLKKEFKLALARGKSGGVTNYAIRNNLKVNEIQQLLLNIKNNSKIQTFEDLSKEIKLIEFKIETLEKDYDICNSKLGQLNTEIAQLEYKLVKNGRGMEF